MKQRMIVAMGLSLATVFLLQYFTQKKEVPGQGGQVQTENVKSGGFYSAPTQQSWHREPNREIDFVDTKIDRKQEKLTTVETDLYQATFSSFGATLQSLSFKKHQGNY